MEDLRQTALGYYKAATHEIRHVVEEVYKEMDPNDNGYVRFKEFSAYMETVGCEKMSSEEFYDELKHGGNDKLYFDDIITLFYIIHSNRPFCGGKCKKFVKGTYFTCVKCFDFDHDDKGSTSTFSVCSQCFADENFEHRHKEFLDPIVLLHLKRMEALTKQKSTTMDAEAARSSSSTTSDNGTIESSASNPKYERSTSEINKTVLMNPCPPSSATSNSNSQSDKQGTSSNSISNAIVPAVNQRSKEARIQTAIQFGQLAASIGSIVVASQLCTIM